MRTKSLSNVYPVWAKKKITVQYLWLLTFNIRTLICTGIYRCRHPKLIRQSASGAGIFTYVNRQSQPVSYCACVSRAALSEWSCHLLGCACVPEDSREEEEPEILKDRCSDLTQRWERVSVKTRYLLPPQKKSAKCGNGVNKRSFSFWVELHLILAPMIKSHTALKQVSNDFFNPVSTSATCLVTAKSHDKSSP